MPNIDEEIFNRNLLLTQAYCEMQMSNTDRSPAEVLRSFNPEYDGKPLFTYEMLSYMGNRWDHVIWAVDPLRENSNNSYDELYDRQLKNKQRATENLTLTPCDKGRILVAEIDVRC